MQNKGRKQRSANNLQSNLSALEGLDIFCAILTFAVPKTVAFIYLFLIVGNSASTPVPATRNCAVDYCIAASIGVTDVRVQ